MKRLILLLVLVLHSIRFYNDCRSASALTTASTPEHRYISSNRYFQFEKGNYHASTSIGIRAYKIANL